MKDRNESIQSLSFPYPAFKTGQKYLNQDMYSVAKRGVDLMVRTATRIGEIISTLSPSVKAMGEDFADKIFYLVAKSTLKEARSDQLYLMKQGGLIIKSVEIITENKVCINNEVKCNPNDCEFTKGRYDRVNRCTLDMLENEDIIVEEIIEKYAFEYRVCPLELELDLSSFCDIVVCDYGYVFDPAVYLKRFFEVPYLRMSLLADEVHSLVSRGHDMYLYSLSFNRLIDCCDELINDKKELKIKRDLKKIAKQIKDKALGRPINTYKNLSIDLIDYCIRCKESITKFLIEEKDKPHYDKVLSVYFEVNKFLKISDFYDDSFITLIKSENDDVIYDIMCLSTHNIFKDLLKKYKSNVFFSATLSPMIYFADVLGLEKFYDIGLESPFPKENLEVNHISISTRFKDHEDTKYETAGTLRKVNEKPGNKLIFLPSYSYLKSMYEICDFSISAQERALTDVERLKFLSQFTTNSNIMAFCVLDGALNEGVDLSDDRLNTVGIISVGLPRISAESDLIKKYSDENGKNGFGYAYVYPGMGKVHQAGGRLVRTDVNTGELLLTDNRFDSYPYKSLLPNNWK